MSIRKYRALLTTIELGSLTKAAKELGYTQPGISHMILSLENEFGFPLLIRYKDGVIPTEDAKELLFYLRQIVNGEAKLHETINKVKGMETGLIRIGSFYSVSVHWLPSIIQSYSQKYPNIHLELFEGDHGEITSWLVEGKIDIAFMSKPIPDGFEFIPIKNDPILAVLPLSHPLAKKAKISTNDLTSCPFIIPYEGSDEDVWRVISVEHLTSQIKYRVKGDESIISMVSKGLGVSLMPELLLQRLPENVTTKPLATPYYRTLGIVVPSTKYASPSIKKFLEIIPR